MPRTKETKDKVGGLSGVRRSSPRAAAAALQGPEISDAGHMTEGEKFWRVSAAAAAEVVHSLRNKNDDDPALLEKDVMALHDNGVAKKTIKLEEVNEDAEGVSADVDEKEQDGVVLKSNKAKTAPRGGNVSKTNRNCDGSSSEGSESSSESEDSSDDSEDSSDESDDSSDDREDTDEEEKKVVNQSDEVRCAGRRWKRNYYLAVRGRWERGEIDEETYWCFGADSDCSFFNESP